MLAPGAPEDGRGPRAALDRPCRGAPAIPAPRSTHPRAREHALPPRRDARRSRIRARARRRHGSLRQRCIRLGPSGAQLDGGGGSLVPAYAGLLLLAELDHLGRLLGEVGHPFVLVAGGAKVDDKLAVLENLGGRADTVLIGGKMAEQLRDDNPLSFPVELPVDVVAASSFSEDAETRVATVDAVPPGWLGLDIGPATAEAFGDIVRRARTIFWNGPMGVFEWSRFAAATRALAEAVAAADAYSVVGGGDSVRAIQELGLADRISWVSTGGGASLELLEGRELPGVAAIPEEADDHAHGGQLEDVQGPGRGARLLRRVRGARRRRGRALPAVRLARGRGRRGMADLCAERSTGPTRVRSPARSRRECSRDSASRERSSGIRNDVSTSPRPMRRSGSAQKRRWLRGSP